MQANSQAAVHDNTISQNTATTGGGVFMTAVSQATLNTNQVERNQASQGGGGIALAGLIRRWRTT